VEAEYCQEWVDTKRPRHLVDNDEVRGIHPARLRRRGGGGEALALMLGLAEEIDTSIAEAVEGLRGAAATPGLRSAPGPASSAKPPSSAGQHRLDVCQA
jgi:hypothetical protein